ncbi:carboxymuconolactone decarboxylase family protein [Phytoactinopolyspora alkaliphila]|uniref:Carboxymuconolactone decarboxylase family protein n=2 Tax=Phytoactinopolyspora alkaliphila TaxID=1783498 RepID=A0A6N9YMV2_9ACTN|nr:carboxymuconolactone decarboxylase family protein [Phytoactinopolyspora alkaliphila]
MDLSAATPEGFRAVLGLDKYVRANVDPTLLTLIKLRASVTNGCAFCVDMHTTDALADGENGRRLFAVATWRESPFFTDDERAALALTDAVTELGQDGVPDDVWDKAAAIWNEKQLADLLLAICTINVWNRIAVPTRKQPPALV